MARTGGVAQNIITTILEGYYAYDIVEHVQETAGGGRGELNCQCSLKYLEIPMYTSLYKMKQLHMVILKLQYTILLWGNICKVLFQYFIAIGYTC